MNDKQKPSIRFKGFTEAWEQRKLGEVAEIVGGGTPSTNVSEYWDGNINWYTPAEISDQIYLESSQRKITEEGYSSCSAKMLPVGTVLFTSRAGIGKTAILSQKSCTNQGFQSIVPHKDKLDSYFIFSRSEELKRYGETVGAGSTFVEVSGKQMADMDLMLPKNITEQQIIGSYFKNLDHLITLHQRKYDKLVNVKKSMLEKMFPRDGKNVPEIRFSGFTEAWEQRKLGTLCSLITKGTTPKDKSGNGEVNFIKVENIDIDNGEITSTSKISIVEHEGYLKRSKLKENDILFSIAGTLGRVSVVKSSILPANTNQALAILRINEGYIPYLTTVLKGQAVEDFIRRNPTIGAQPNLSLEQVNNLDISYPNYDEQVRIGQYFSNLDHLITLHQREVEKLQNIKKSCLEKMFV